MLRYLFPAVAAAMLVGALGAHAASADGEGQEDLDRAIERKVMIRTAADLQTVISLCRSALEKGLDEDNAKLARELLASTLYQRADGFSRAVFDRTVPDPRWPAMRRLALADLEKSLDYYDRWGAVHYLIARFQTLPGGDRDRAVKAVGEAVRLFKKAGDRERSSEALVLRATLTDDPDRQLADLNAAVEQDPKNVKALRLRGVYYLGRREYEKSLDDFQQSLRQDPQNVTAHQACAEALIGLKKYEKALSHLDAALKQNPDAAATHLLRARIHDLLGNPKEAVADLDRAIRADPTSVTALLLRAQLRQSQGKLDLAEADVDRVLQLRPGFRLAVQLRALIHASQGKMSPAIADMEGLVHEEPDNLVFRLQLALLYNADRRPRKAIELFTSVLAAQGDNPRALQGRGDARLSIGQQADAVADFDAALKLDSDNTGLLNNLAWVLSTSPDAKLRDGRRAIELAKRACDLTEYKMPHILSTLAAGYAETGDFESAVKWSAKAVELSDPEMKKQLEKELESYRQKKPWRELQHVEEKPEPKPPRDDDLQLKTPISESGKRKAKSGKPKGESGEPKGESGERI